MRTRTYFILAALAALILTEPAEAQSDNPQDLINRQRGWYQGPQPWQEQEAARQRLYQQQQIEQLRQLNQTLEQQRQDQRLRELRQFRPGNQPPARPSWRTDDD